MKKGKNYQGTSGMKMPKMGGSTNCKSVSNYGDMSVGMGGISSNPTTQPNKSKLSPTSNGKSKSPKY